VSERRAIFKNTAVLAAAQIFERVTGLVLVLLISRKLGVGSLGIYATATAYLALISGAAQAGSTNLLVREIAKERGQTNRYLVHAGIMGTLLSMVIMGCAWVALPHLGMSSRLTDGLAVIVLAILPGTLRTIQEAVFVAHQRVEFQTLVVCSASIATVVASVMALALGRGVNALLLIVVLSQYAICAVYLYLTHRHIAPLRRDFSWSFARGFLMEVRAFAAISLITGFFARAEIVLLSLLATETQVGLYAAAFKLVDLWAILPQTLMINVFPVLSRSFHRNDGRSAAIQTFALRYLLALTLPLCVGLAVAAGPIINFFYGKGFADAVILLRILAVSVPLVCIWAVLWRVLAARGEQGVTLRALVLTTGVRIAGGYILIMWFEAIGAAIILVVSFVLYSLALGIGVHRDGSRVRIIRPAWRFAVAAASMGLVVAIADEHVDLWLLVGIACVAYAAFAAIFRAISPREWTYLRALLSSTGHALRGVRAR
jgi:O-antigen/teichoic acid export membrane protein